MSPFASLRMTVLALAALGRHPLHAQAAAPGRPLYSAAQLHCARFAETSRSETETETARGAVKATTERDGIWSFRARDSSAGVRLEAWYDSLSLRRRATESEVSADTDGLIGGRYRGVLRPSGAYVEIARPFIPDEVAEVSDLAAAARDLLPPLPRTALQPGESWRDGGVQLARLPDTTVAGQPMLHFRMDARAEASQVVPHGDTMPVPLRQITTERGAIYWSLASGLIRRTRDITVDASIPSGGRIRQPVRSRVRQHVELTRLPSRRNCS